MAYLERQEGKPEGDYSPELLEIDEVSGPWLAETQRSSAIARANLPRWDLDLEEGVMWFGDEERHGIVAAIQALGTFSSEEQKWIWAWAMPPLARHAELARKASQDHPDVPEFQQDILDCDATKGWTLAAAMAHTLGAEACYRLPNEGLELFVALHEITELDPSDPRSRRLAQDADLARSALSEYAGPAALHIGAMLLEAVKEEPLDPVIGAIHALCDKLDALGQSPVGRETPAASEAAELSQRLRGGVLGLSLPPGHPGLVEGAKQVLALLEETARRYGSWPGDGGA
jgi:hypothetical protein